MKPHRNPSECRCCVCAAARATNAMMGLLLRPELIVSTLGETIGFVHLSRRFNDQAPPFPEQYRLLIARATDKA